MKTQPIKHGQPRLIELDRPARATPEGWELPAPPPLVGSEGTTRHLLHPKCVLVVGCGSVGGTIADGLARAGIGRLILTDPKRFKPASLATHCVRRADVGEFKALITGLNCKDASPDTRVFVFAGRLEDLALGFMAGVDLVVIAPDNLPAEMEAAQRCTWLGIPLIQASVHGATLTAQVRFCRNADASSPCLACGYGPAEREMLIRKTRFSCESASATAPSAPTEPATNSLRSLCAVAGSMAVLHGIRFLLQVGKPQTDAIIEYCAFTHQTVVSPVKHSAKCPNDHSRFEQASASSPLATRSLAQLTQEFTGAPPVPGTRYRVGSAQWVEMASCNCPQPQTIRRFVSPGAKACKCPRCGSQSTPLSFYAYESPSASILGAAMQQPLARLGLNKVTSVLIRTGESTVLVKPSTMS